MSTACPDPGSITEVGVGIVVRPIPNTPRTSPANITQTDCDQTLSYEILITRRPEHTVYGGYWELPGGKFEPGEKSEECVRRELAEEVGIQIELLTPLSERVHTYAHGTVRLHPWICRLAPDSPPPQNIHVTDHRWCPVGQIDSGEFPEANIGVISELAEKLARGIEGLG